MLTIAVTAESADEPRVAVSPDTVKKLTALGATVRIESGAGSRSRFTDEMYKEQGAEIAASGSAALSGADIFLKVRRPSAEEVAQLKPGALVVANLAPHDDRPGLDALAAKNV